MTKKRSAEKTVRDIRRATRRHYSAEEKIRIVLEGLRGEDSIAELCRREGINSNVYYRWSKEFLEADPAYRRYQKLPHRRWCSGVMATAPTCGTSRNNSGARSQTLALP